MKDLRNEYGVFCLDYEVEDTRKRINEFFMQNPEPQDCYDVVRSNNSMDSDVLLVRALLPKNTMYVFTVKATEDLFKDFLETYKDVKRVF